MPLPHAARPLSDCTRIPCAGRRPARSSSVVRSTAAARTARRRPPMATAMAQAHLAMDSSGWEWDEEVYRRGILRGRDLSCRTLFRAVFFDHSDDPDPDVLLAAASSDGSLASFSLSQPEAAALVDPVCIVQAHSGHAYDARFYPDPQQPLLFSCGDDGRIRSWRWHQIQSCLLPFSLQAILYEEQEARTWWW